VLIGRWKWIIHYHFGKRPALPQVSSSSTVPGMVRYGSVSFALFPLTLTLSRREREQRAPQSEKRNVWIVLHGENGSPSPQGGGLRWEQTTSRRSENVLDISCGRCPQGYFST